MFEVLETGLEGFLEIRAKTLHDDRGFFRKTFHTPFFEQNGIASDYKEQFITSSRKDVLRGLHFQSPPYDHSKLVYCLSGKVMDVAVDLRSNRPTYGQHRVLTLSAESGNAAYLEKGFAHGFLVMSDIAIMVYNVTTIHSPKHDLGLLWSSCQINWPTLQPIISSRDKSLPKLADFESPF